MEFQIEEIVKILGGELEGHNKDTINGLSEIQNARKGDITFLSNIKYEKDIYSTQATAVIVAKSFNPDRELTCSLIRVEDPYTSFAQLLTMEEEMQKPRKTGISSSADISKEAIIGKGVFIGENTVIRTAELGDNTVIESNVFIGEQVSIGKNCVVHPGAKIMGGSIIGDNCEIHPGAVIGSDGFGFAPQADGSYIRIPQIGNVIIEDNVSVGANSTIDRATISSTIIRNGVKIDNLVQVAHNCEIGENSVIAAQTGIAGSTKIGANCVVGGQAGFSGHIEIADETKIGAQAGVMSNVKEKGKQLVGSPAIDAKEYMRIFAASRKVPELIRSVRDIEKNRD